MAASPCVSRTFWLLLATIAMASCDAAAAGPPLLDTQQRAQPVWAQQHSQDIQLNFSTADPEFEQFKRAEGEFVFQHYKSRRVKVRSHSGWYYGNTALVRYGSEFVMAVRRMSIFKTNQSAVALEPKFHPLQHDLTVDWWASTVLLCSVHATQLTPLSCKPFDPRPWRECLWNGVFEGTGIEDPRLVVWPGKGLFMMFGSKPPAFEQQGDLTPWRLRCSGRVVFQQYMVRLHPPPASGDNKEDLWGRGVVPLVYEGHQQQPKQHKRSAAGSSDGSSSGRKVLGSSSYDSRRGSRRMHGDSSTDAGSSSSSSSDQQGAGDIKEKNWNPFVYKGHLLFSHSFVPQHIVLQPLPNGTCVQRFATPNPVMARAFAGKQPRGNTQAVLVPSALSGEARSYYLGMMHVEANRSYSNHFYRMQPAPPFHILAVSGPVPIKGRQHPAVRGWDDVSFPMSLDMISETGMVVIGYGSGDSASHVKLMPLKDVQALFEAAASAATADAMTQPVPAKAAVAAAKQALPAAVINKNGKGKDSSVGSSNGKSWRPSKGKQASSPNVHSSSSSSSKRRKSSRQRHHGDNSKIRDRHVVDDMLGDGVDEDKGAGAGQKHERQHSTADLLLGAAPAGAVGGVVIGKREAISNTKAHQQV